MSSCSVSWLEGPQKTKFFTRFYQAATPQAVIVFVHGFCEHSTRYVEFHTKLADSGISVFAYDQRGFGRTSMDEKERSKNSSYGRTGWDDQMADLNWAIGYARQQVPEVPLFIMGQSMGGGEVLGFATEGDRSPYAATIASLAGVIATSPMIQQTTPVNRILRSVLSGVKLALPNMLFPADLIPGHLSRDGSVGEAYMKDEFVKNTGSLRNLADMLNHGDEIKGKRWNVWPKSLPVIICHGTDDKITSCNASQEFLSNIACESKHFVPFEGAYHELANELPDVKERLLREVVGWVEKTVKQPTEVAKL